jgi:cytochrome c
MSCVGLSKLSQRHVSEHINGCLLVHWLVGKRRPLDCEMTFRTKALKEALMKRKLTAGPQSKEAKQIVALVDKAAALTESKGKTTFPEFKKKGSEWLKGESYIFIIDMNGTTLMHPANPELETKSILDLKDENGKAFVREFIETAKKGSGWVDYVWPKPGEKKPAEKLSYIKRAKMLSGETVLVGAGIYAK